MDVTNIGELGNTARLMAMPIFLAFVGLVVLVSDIIFNREDERRWPAYLTIAGLVGSLFLWVQSWLLFHPQESDNAFFGAIRQVLKVATLSDTELQNARALFGGMFDAIGYSNMTLVTSLMIIIVTLIVTLISPAYLERRGLLRGEFYALLIFASVGLIIMAGSVHLIMLFLGIELLSIPLYILAGFARPQLKSQESALKYFLLGAFASGFLLYGIALIYGATGTMSISGLFAQLGTDMNAIGAAGTAQILEVNGAPNYMLLAGLTFLIVGIGFKISLVPFHQWTPDVYEGAPTPVTAFMVAGTKIGGFAALSQIMIGFYALREWWSNLFAIIAVLTMIVGNVGALRQSNVKRMLAYSSIAHAGYMMVGLAGLGEGGLFSLSSVIFYLAIYSLMNLGAFAVLMAIEEVTGKERLEITDFRGLGKEQPFLSVLLAFFLLSLAGFPPTAGFFAKFFMFSASLLGDKGWLIVVGTVLSVISIVYYARYVIAMFMQSADDVTAPTAAEVEVDENAIAFAPAPTSAASAWMVQTALIVTTVVMIVIGLFPGPLLGLF